MLFLKKKATIQEIFYQMSCMKEKLSIYAKKLYPLFPNCYFIDFFPCCCCFHQGKHLDFDFFIKFLDNIEKFSAFGLELFNIILEFNEKNLNPSVFPDGNSNIVEKSIKY